MKELVNFLRTLYHKIDLIINDLSFEIIFVIGNTSCDMDSLMSSILLAYLRNLECKMITYTNQNEITFNNFSRVNKLYIPIVNCQKGELFWRLDIAELLYQIDIEERDLFYFSDVFDENGRVVFDRFLKRSKGNADYIYIYNYICFITISFSFLFVVF